MVLVNPHGGVVRTHSPVVRIGATKLVLNRAKPQLSSSTLSCQFSMLLAVQSKLPVCAPRYIVLESSTNARITATRHRGHAREIARALKLEYDAIVTLSGDGIVHEILNGFAEHAEPRKAFATPVVPIPTGSGNGLSLNILGLEVRCTPFE